MKRAGGYAQPDEDQPSPKKTKINTDLEKEALLALPMEVDDSRNRK